MNLIPNGRVSTRRNSAAARASAGPVCAAVCRPSACAASTKTASLSSVRACTGVFDTSRRAVQTSPLGPSNVADIANGAVRLLNVYNPRR